jgi:hypothetical protein
MIGHGEIVRSTATDHHEGSTTIGHGVTVRSIATGRHEALTTTVLGKTDRSIATGRLGALTATVLGKAAVLIAVVLQARVDRNPMDTTGSSRLGPEVETKRPFSVLTMRRRTDSY